MVNTINTTRENTAYTIKMGVGSNNKYTLFMEEADGDEDLLRHRWLFRSLIVETEVVEEDNEVYTNVTKIETRWCKVRVSSTGKTLQGFQEIEVVITNQEDIEAFILMYATIMSPAIINGLMRDVMGHNHLPVIDTRKTIDGEPNPNFGLPFLMTEYLKTVPPTKDYNNWKQGDPLPEILTEPVEGE